LDTIQSDVQELPDSDVMEISLQEEINQTLDTLSEREKEVIRLYFGIGGEAALTLEEIGKRFNLTRERARQIKEKALWRLKHAARCKLLKIYCS
jgi:RNA polymerase primary sigma factor